MVAASNARSVPRPFDHAVTLVLLTRLVSLVAAPITLWLVATRRPLAEQGPYFVFWNVQALTQLMELGIGGLIVQFASHDSPFLAWGARGGLEGDAQARERIRILVHQGRRWYGFVALIVLGVVGMGGLWLLAATTANIRPSPLAPWVVTVVCTAVYLPLVPSLCAIEGCGGLVRVQRMRLAQVVLAMAALWIALPRWGTLWAVAVFSFVWVATAWAWLRIAHPAFLADVGPRSEPTDAGSERQPGIALIPVQWRTFLTWITWWATPQALTPIVLATHGPAPAGQVGMSLAIAMAPLTLANAWLQGRYPQYGALVAVGKSAELRRVAGLATAQAMIVCAAGTLGATLVVWLIGANIPSLAARALPAIAITILGAANLGWLVVQSMASYWRAWREEPLTEATVVGTALVVGGTLAAALLASVWSAVIVYSLLVVLGMLPLSALAFRRRAHRQSPETARASTDRP